MPIDGDSIRERQKKEAAALESFSRRVEQLRIAYERFFMGIDRVPPAIDHQKLERDLRNSPLVRSRNTALRFQFNNVRQRLLSYARYWSRIMRLIEEGKFRRERNSMAGTGAPTAPPEAKSDKPSQKPGEDARRLFDAWQEAHAKVGKTSRADFETFAARVEAQRTRQVQSKGWKDVAFDVKVDGDKVRLVGKPIKDGGEER